MTLILMLQVPFFSLSPQSVFTYLEFSFSRARSTAAATAADASCLCSMAAVRLLREASSISRAFCNDKYKVLQH